MSINQALRKIFVVSAVVAIASIAGFLGFFGWRFLETAGRIHIENGPTEGNFKNVSSLLPGTERIKLRNEDEGRINILLLGRAGESYPGKNLTDTVILASVDTHAHRAGFLSLLRDLFVPIPGTNLSTKLNSLYQHSLSAGKDAELVLKTAEAITGQEIPYFIILDFDGFEKIIDDLGGIRVFSERDILDTRYPGKNYSYETFELPAGWHTLDGKTALKYVRERHSDPEGDFGRAKRQQQVIKAAQEKAFSIGTILNIFAMDRLLETLGDSIRTNLSLAEIGSLAEVVRTVDLRNASTVVVDAWKRESLLRVSHIDVSGIRAFILVPRTGNWNEIRNITENIFDQETEKHRQGLIRDESASVLVLSRPEHAAKAKTFAGILSESLPIKEASSMSSALLEKNTKSVIIDKVSLGKPYTLDEILKLFPLEKSTREDVPIARGANTGGYDFVIVFGEDIASSDFSDRTLDRERGEPVISEDAFPELFPTQER